MVGIWHLDCVFNVNVVTHVNMLIKVVNGSCLQLCKDFIPCKLRVGDLFLSFYFSTRSIIRRKI